MRDHAAMAMRISLRALVGVVALASLTGASALTPHADAARNGRLAAEVTGPCEETSLGGDCEETIVGVITVRPDGSAPRRLPVPTGFHAPMFSGDGRSLAFDTYVGLAVTTGEGRARRWTPHAFPAGMDWSPSGHTLVYALRDFGPTLYRVNADGRYRRRLGPGSHPAWSPNGRWIAYSRYSDAKSTTRILIMHPDGRSVRILRTLAGEARVKGWTRDGHGVVYCGDCCSDCPHRSIIDVQTGHLRTAPWSWWLISPDGRLRAKVGGYGSTILVGPLGGPSRRILGPPRRWSGTGYDGLDWQRLPGTSLPADRPYGSTGRATSAPPTTGDSSEFGQSMGGILRMSPQRVAVIMGAWRGASA